MALTAIGVTVLIVLIGAAACAERAAPKETVESLRAKSRTLKDRETLRIGVSGNVPALNFRDPRTGEFSGFEIELARALATELGYPEQRIEWVVVDRVADQISVLQDGTADIVLANVSITDARAEFVDFAGPYRLERQAVLVPQDRANSLDTIEDLRAGNVRVCTATGSTSERSLLEKGIRPLPVSRLSDCMTGMRSGQFDAFSADETILAALSGNEEDSRRFDVLDVTIADGANRIGVALPNGDEALSALIAYFLDRWQRGPAGASPWLRAYDRTIGPLLRLELRSQPRVDIPAPPDLADFE